MAGCRASSARAGWAVFGHHEFSRMEILLYCNLTFESVSKKL